MLLLAFIYILFILSSVIDVVAIRIPLDEGEDCLGDHPLDEEVNCQLSMHMQECATGEQILSRIKLTTILQRPWPYRKDDIGVKIVRSQETAQGKTYTLSFSDSWLCADGKSSALTGHGGKEDEYM